MKLKAVSTTIEKKKGAYSLHITAEFKGESERIATVESKSKEFVDELSAAMTSDALRDEVNRASKQAKAAGLDQRLYMLRAIVVSLHFIAQGMMAAQQGKCPCLECTTSTEARTVH